MSGAKLNKKHEQNMSTTVKNGKHRTNYMTLLKLMITGLLLLQHLLSAESGSTKNVDCCH